MNREDLYSAITQVDERYIDEAAADIRKGRRRLRPWVWYGALAACLLLMLASPLGRQFYQNVQAQLELRDSTETGAVPEDADGGETEMEAEGGEEFQEQRPQGEENPEEDAAFGEAATGKQKGEWFVPEGEIISENPPLNAVYCYAAPEDGEWFSGEGVKRALEEHAGEDCYYFLAIDLFQEEEVLDCQSEAAQAELSRLREQGYLVGLAEAADEDGGTETYAAGYFTAEGLEQLEASENYGYRLYFRSEEFWSTGDGIALAPLP